MTDAFPMLLTDAHSGAAPAVPIEVSSTAPWLILAGLGAFHGLNPAMGWLFAVALGLQERSRRAVLRALPPIVLGHAGSVLLTLALVAAVRVAAPPKVVAYAVGAVLGAFGIWRLVRRRHPRWVGMRVTLPQLTGWSFLMSTAHGAGLMLLPVTMAMPGGSGEGHGDHVGHAGPAGGDTATPVIALTEQTLLATAVHTLAMLTVTTAVAVVVYERLGVAVLRKAWFNLDLVWGVALIGAGAFAALT